MIKTQHTVKRLHDVCTMYLNTTFLKLHYLLLFTMLPYLINFSNFIILCFFNFYIFCFFFSSGEVATRQREVAAKQRQRPLLLASKQGSSKASSKQSPYIQIQVLINFFNFIIRCLSICYAFFVLPFLSKPENFVLPFLRKPEDPFIAQTIDTFLLNPEVRLEDSTFLVPIEKNLQNDLCLESGSIKEFLNILVDCFDRTDYSTANKAFVSFLRTYNQKSASILRDTYKNFTAKDQIYIYYMCCKNPLNTNQFNLFFKEILNVILSNENNINYFLQEYDGNFFIHATLDGLKKIKQFETIFCNFLKRLKTNASARFNQAVVDYEKYEPKVVEYFIQNFADDLDTLVLDTLVLDTPVLDTAVFAVEGYSLIELLDFLETGFNPKNQNGMFIKNDHGFAISPRREATDGEKYEEFSINMLVAALTITILVQRKNALNYPIKGLEKLKSIRSYKQQIIRGTPGETWATLIACLETYEFAKKDAYTEYCNSFSKFIRETEKFSKLDYTPLNLDYAQFSAKFTSALEFFLMYYKKPLKTTQQVIDFPTVDNWEDYLYQRRSEIINTLLLASLKDPDYFGFPSTVTNYSLTDAVFFILPDGLDNLGIASFTNESGTSIEKINKVFNKYSRLG